MLLCILEPITGLLCNCRRSSLSPATLHKLISCMTTCTLSYSSVQNQLLRSQWHDVRICRSAPFALCLLDVGHFFICDFEWLRVAGLHQLANSNNSPPSTAVPRPVGGSWVGESPLKTLLPGTGPTCTPSSIHPTVWPQYIDVINRGLP